MTSIAGVNRKPLKTLSVFNLVLSEMKLCSAWCVSCCHLLLAVSEGSTVYASPVFHVFRFKSGKVFNFPLGDVLSSFSIYLQYYVIFGNHPVPSNGWRNLFGICFQLTLHNDKNFLMSWSYVLSGMLSPSQACLPVPYWMHGKLHWERQVPVRNWIFSDVKLSNTPNPELKNSWFT